MDKFFTRIAIIVVAVYFLISYVCAQFGIDILTSSYVLLFELCVVSYTFCSGSFHCKYIRWTALSCLLVDVLSHADYYFDFIPVSIFNIIPIAILAIGLSTSATLAVRHFYKVLRVKRMKNGRK